METYSDSRAEVFVRLLNARGDICLSIFRKFLSGSGHSMCSEVAFVGEAKKSQPDVLEGLLAVYGDRRCCHTCSLLQHPQGDGLITVRMIEPSSSRIGFHRQYS